MIVAVSGHRDTVMDKALKERLETFFADLSVKHDTIVLLSALADGADQYVAEIALRYDNIAVEVPLPLEKTAYIKTIKNKIRFNALLKSAQKVHSLPDRYDHPYENLGRYLVDRADILLSLWDGSYNDKIGGTGEVIRYARTLEKPIVHIVVNRQCAS